MPAMRVPHLRVRSGARVFLVRGVRVYRSAPAAVKIAGLVIVLVGLAPWVMGVYVAYLLWIMTLFGVDMAP